MAVTVDHQVGTRLMSETFVTAVTTTTAIDSNASDDTVPTSKAVKAYVDASKESGVVHNTGNETIGGVKTFTSSPIMPTLGAFDSSESGATTAWVNNYVRSWWGTQGTGYLSLTGGTMSGAITVADEALKRANNSGYLAIYGGSTSSGGAYVELAGNSSAQKTAGSFTISTGVSASGSNTYALQGKTDKTLTWAGQHLVRQINNKTVDSDDSAAGKVVLTASDVGALPTAGGTMAGDVTMSSAKVKGVSDTASVKIQGGSTASDGGSLEVYGKSNSTNAGGFNLTAKNDSTTKALVGKTDGTLTWGGANVVRMVNGKSVASGKTATGEVVLTASDIGALPTTGGAITGNVTINGKSVVRSINSVDADTSGNVDLSNVCVTSVNGQKGAVTTFKIVSSPSEITEENVLYFIQ